MQRLDASEGNAKLVERHAPPALSCLFEAELLPHAIRLQRTRMIEIAPLPQDVIVRLMLCWDRRRKLVD